MKNTIYFILLNEILKNIDENHMVIFIFRTITKIIYFAIQSIWK
jgi:hypothetical protein